MDERAYARLFGGRLPQGSDDEDDNEGQRQRLIARHVRERRDHQFSQSIGGDSSNYREPKFGPGK